MTITDNAARARQLDADLGSSGMCEEQQHAALIWFIVSRGQEHEFRHFVASDFEEGSDAWRLMLEGIPALSGGATQ